MLEMVCGSDLLDGWVVEVEVMCAPRGSPLFSKYDDFDDV